MRQLMGQTFYVHSMTRDARMRVHRMRAPQHHTPVQRFAGGDIVVKPKRPVQVSEARLLKHIAELRQAVKEGRIEVRNAHGLLVDLDTFTVEKPLASKPLPNPPLDSVARDKQIAVPVRQYPDSPALVEPVEMPALLKKIEEEPVKEPEPEVVEVSEESDEDSEDP